MQLLQELDPIAALSAAEAFVRVPLRGHTEGGCFFIVKRAIALSVPVQLDESAHNLVYGHSFDLRQ
jgi:hypothetical protein